MLDLKICMGPLWPLHIFCFVPQIFYKITGEPSALVTVTACEFCLSVSVDVAAHNCVCSSKKEPVSLEN
jgi:hypothetical protein